MSIGRVESWRFSKSRVRRFLLLVNVAGHGLGDVTVCLPLRRALACHLTLVDCAPAAAADAV